MPFRTWFALAIAAVTIVAGQAASAASAASAAPAAGAAGAAAPAVTAQPEKTNLNAASKEALLAVPGIGPRMAQAIVDLRTRKGGYQRIEELLEVRGIGEKNLKLLARYLVVPAALPPTSATAK